MAVDPEGSEEHEGLGHEKPEEHEELGHEEPGQDEGLGPSDLPAAAAPALLISLISSSYCLYHG